jgi:CheY-like chemotaxis protein
MTTESPPVVLVADDEPSMLALVGQHIKTMGYTVLEASDGEQAWSLAQEHLPDLVILDVMMPGMSGWEVCRKIREDVALAHTAIIMLTGIGENLNELTSPLYGADSYIDKPFAFSELDDKVRGALHKHQGPGPGLARTEPGEDEPGGNGGREHRLITTPPSESGPPVPDEAEQGWTGNENPDVVNGADESVMLVKTESLTPQAEGRRAAHSAMRPPSARKSRQTHRRAAPPTPPRRAAKAAAKPVAKGKASKPVAKPQPARAGAAKAAAPKAKGKALRSKPAPKTPPKTPTKTAIKTAPKTSQKVPAVPPRAPKRTVAAKAAKAIARAAKAVKSKVLKALPAKAAKRPAKRARR